MNIGYGSVPAYPAFHTSSTETIQRKFTRQSTSIYSWVTVGFYLVFIGCSVYSLFTGVIVSRCADPPYFETAEKSVESPGVFNSATIYVANQRGSIRFESGKFENVTFLIENHSANEDGLKEITSTENIEQIGNDLYVDYIVQHGKWSLSTCLLSDITLEIPESIISSQTSAMLLFEIEKGELVVVSNETYTLLSILSVEDSDIHIRAVKTPFFNLKMKLGEAFVENAALENVQITSDAAVVRLSNVLGRNGVVDISTQSGNIQIQQYKSDGGSIQITTSTGTVNLIIIVRTNINVVAGDSDIVIRVIDTQMAGSFSLKSNGLISVGGDGEYEITSSASQIVTGTISENGSYSINVISKGSVTLRVQAEQPPPVIGETDAIMLEAR